VLDIVSSPIIIRMSASRKLAAEAADNGLLAPELAAGISRVKGAKCVSFRGGHWLPLRQAQALLSAPDIDTPRGLRDRAMLAVPLGCGLRRSEVAALTFAHVQRRDGRWCIADLVGEHDRVRTGPMPTWVKLGIDAWTSAAQMESGRGVPASQPCRPRKRRRPVEKAVRQFIKPSPDVAGVPGIAPLDLCRTCAKLCRAGGSDLSGFNCCSGTLRCRPPSGI
jgi:integrase